MAYKLDGKSVGSSKVSAKNSSKTSSTSSYKASTKNPYDENLVYDDDSGYWYYPDAQNNNTGGDFWYSLTHPISTLTGAIKGSENFENMYGWTSQEISDYAYNGVIPERFKYKEPVSVSSSDNGSMPTSDSGAGSPTYTGTPVGSTEQNTINENGSASTNSANQVQFDVDHFIDRYIDLYNQQRDYENALAQQNTAEARAWQDYMSSTAHQREVQDLEAAGLNKWMSANNGGASTPATSAATVSSTGSSDSVNSAIGIANVIANMSNVNSQNMAGILRTILKVLA